MIIKIQNEMKELNLILPQVDGKFSQGRKFPIDLKIRIERSAGGDAFDSRIGETEMGR